MSADQASEQASDRAGEKIPAVFRKTKTEKWAVMAPVADLEKALAEGGKVDVLKKSGDWSSFRVVSLGRPFDVDGVEMCYGYADEGDGDGATASTQSSNKSSGQKPNQSNGGQPRRANTSAAVPPPRDETEPLPEYQGGPEDEWSGF